MKLQVIQGDSLRVLRKMLESSVDAIVCDPPAGIHFMGKAFDHDRGGRTEWVAWLAGIMAEALRVLRPGACAFVWALPRTSHWTGTALEDAGFEVRDVVTHIQGQGFPKSKALLKPASEHWILARKPGPLQELRIDDCRVGSGKRVPESPPRAPNKVYGARPASAAQGGTAGYDANVGRWPSNFCLSHSEGCRQEGTKLVKGDARQGGQGIRPGGFVDIGADKGSDKPCGPLYGAPGGTEEVAAWICEPQCPVALLDQQSGVRTSGKPVGKRKARGVFLANPRGMDLTGYGDTGTASRFFHQFPYEPFFYQPKASRSERNAGCEGLPEQATAAKYQSGEGFGGRSLVEGAWQNTNNPRRPTRNHHPTVKPVALMRWLCRLITPPGGLVLDPFAGSGTTGVACAAEGLAFVGIEREAEYVAIARARLAAAQSAFAGAA